MEIVKSYHAIAVHDSGRSPTFEEYERAIKYASRGTLAEKTLMKMLVTGPKDTERVLDWVRDYNIVPLDYVWIQAKCSTSTSLLYQSS